MNGLVGSTPITRSLPRRLQPPALHVGITGSATSSSEAFWTGCFTESLVHLHGSLSLVSIILAITYLPVSLIGSTSVAVRFSHSCSLCSRAPLRLRRRAHIDSAPDWPAALPRKSTIRRPG